MAIRVPSFGDQQVAPVRLPGATQLSDAGGGSIARGLGTATDMLAGVQAKQQQQRDATRVFEAEFEVDELWRTKESEYREHKGSAAYNLQNDAQDWWDGAEVSRISASLDNEAQRDVFRQAVARRRGSSLDALAVYESKELSGARDLAARSAISTQTSFAAQNYDSPSAVAAAREDILQKIGMLAGWNGWDSNATDAAVRENLTHMHRQVFENLLNDEGYGAEVAEKYFETFKQEIDGSTWERYISDVKTGKGVAAAQAAADEAWATGLRGTDLFDYVRDNFKDETRQGALTMVRQRDAETRAETERAISQQVDSIFAKFDAAGGNIRALSPGDMAFMQRHDLRGLTAMRNTNPQQVVQTDWEVNEELAAQVRASFQDPVAAEAFAKVNLDDYRDKLSKPQLDQLRSDQQAIIGSLQGKPPGRVATTQQILAEAHQLMKWSGASDARKIGQYDQAVRSAIGEQQRRLGRELDDAEERAIAMRYLTQLDVPWRSDPRLYEIVGGAVDLPSNFRVPEEVLPQVRQERARTNEARAQRGEPPLPDNDASLRESYFFMLREGYFD